MIILRLSGGLGNQIFQLGAAFLLAKSSKIKTITIDDSSLNRYRAKRENDLINFFDFSNSHASVVFSENLITKLRLPKLLPLNYKYLSFVSDKNFQESLNPNLKSFLLLDGYFQRCLRQEDFDEMVKLVNQVFKLPLLDCSQDECVIHIRGGDFLELGLNLVTPFEYYERSIEYMVKNCDVKKFLIVTDDPDYAMKIINLSDFLLHYELISGDIISDFQIIASNTKRIISNSTFALWASALGDNNNNITIAPKLFNKNKIRPFRLKGEISIAPQSCKSQKIQ